MGSLYVLKKKMFRELIEHQVYSDVTLVTNDQHQFKVNEFILTSCSSIFKNLLEDYSKKCDRNAS